MKDLILTKAICVITATIILGMIMVTVALITPAAAQDRLAENPDIHSTEVWRRFHAWSMRQAQAVRPGEMYDRCNERCVAEVQLCMAKYANKPGTSVARANVALRDCTVLNQQCIAKECVRYRP